MNSTSFRRVSRCENCPICGKPDWCLIAGPEGCITAAICARAESARPIGNAGWLHRLRDDEHPRQYRRTIRFDKPSPHPAVVNFPALVQQFADALKPDVLEYFAAGLGVSANSLSQLQVGWSDEHRCYSFPMSDATGRTVGIRLRRPRGDKFAVRGGREGLFLPTGGRPGGRLVIAEGATDCAALLDWGFAAVGRPSCTGGVELLVEVVKLRQPAEIVIVSDGDIPGQRGAENLAAVMLAFSSSVKVILPPVGLKDARAWKQSGATPADVLATITAAPLRNLAIRAQRKGAQS